MKTYIFEHLRADAENLTGEQIRNFEQNHGKLIGVVTPKGFVSCVYRSDMKEVEDLASTKRRQNAGFN